jgi:peptide/nickel transport system permease protein
VTTLPIESAPPEAPPRASGGRRPPSAAAMRWRVPLLIGRRLIGAVVSLAAIVLFNFFLFNVLSSNPIRALVRNRHLDAAAQAKLRHEFGYDQSKWQQFIDYCDQLFLHHNLGISTYYTQPVWNVITERIWPTVLLVGVSTVLSSVIGTWIGIKGAWERGSAFDKISNGVSVTLYSVPEFWLGLMLLLFLAGDQVGLGWFPTGGIYDDDVKPASMAGWINIGWHLVLPGLTLTLAYLAQYQLVMRSSMLDEMGQDYVQTARAKGLRELAVRRQHVVPNALLPAVTQILLYFGFVISGALLVETVFSWPGLGLLTETAVSGTDFPLLRGLFLLFTGSVIVCNLIADVLLGVIDPRVREL